MEYKPILCEGGTSKIIYCMECNSVQGWLIETKYHDKIQLCSDCVKQLAINMKIPIKEEQPISLCDHTDINSLEIDNFSSGGVKCKGCGYHLSLNEKISIIFKELKELKKDKESGAPKCDHFWEHIYKYSKNEVRCADCNEILNKEVITDKFFEVKDAYCNLP